MSKQAWKLDQEDEELINRASEILIMGPSWAVREFIEDILWHGWATGQETLNFQRCKLRELVTLYGV